MKTHPVLTALRDAVDVLVGTGTETVKPRAGQKHGLRSLGLLTQGGAGQKKGVRTLAPNVTGHQPSQTRRRPAEAETRNFCSNALSLTHQRLPAIWQQTPSAGSWGHAFARVAGRGLGMDLFSEACQRSGVGVVNPRDTGPACSRRSPDPRRARRAPLGAIQLNKKLERIHFKLQFHCIATLKGRESEKGLGL